MTLIDAVAAFWGHSQKAAWEVTREGYPDHTVFKVQEVGRDGTRRTLCAVDDLDFVGPHPGTVARDVRLALAERFAALFVSARQLLCIVACYAEQMGLAADGHPPRADTAHEAWMLATKAVAEHVPINLVSADGTYSVPLGTRARKAAAAAAAAESARWPFPDRDTHDLGGEG